MSRSELEVRYFGPGRTENIQARICEFGNKVVKFGNLVVNLGNFLYRICQDVMQMQSRMPARCSATSLPHSVSCHLLCSICLPLVRTQRSESVPNLPNQARLVYFKSPKSDNGKTKITIVKINHYSDFK
jgi:hypothetical protein